MSNQPKTSPPITADVLSSFIDIARYAPSSHNTQPWQTSIKSDKIVVGFDPERHLKVGDPEKRELYLSLGAFIETIVQAAREAGWQCVCSLEDRPPSTVAQLSFERLDSRKDTLTLAKYVTKRRSDRRHYSTKIIPAGVRSELDKLTIGNAEMVLVDTPREIEFLANVTHEATLSVMSDKAFRTELSNWVRHNWTRRHDGMPGYTQGMPGPVSLLAKVVVKNVKGVAKDQASKDASRVKHSAAIGLVCAVSDTGGDWIDAGRLYQRACLLALHYDIRTSAVSAAVIVPSTALRIQKELLLDKNAVALIRFGYHEGKLPKAAPRRKTTDIITSS